MSLWLGVGVLAVRRAEREIVPNLCLRYFSFASKGAKAGKNWIVDRL
jgi:hypothetical protein